MENYIKHPQNKVAKGFIKRIHKNRTARKVWLKTRNSEGKAMLNTFVKFADMCDEFASFLKTNNTLVYILDGDRFAILTCSSTGVYLDVHKA